MKQFQTIPELLNRLWGHISPKRRTQFLLLLILMVLTSFAEILSIGAALPFLTALTAPEQLFQNPRLENIFQIVNITDPQQLRLPLALGFGIAALLAGSMRLILLWVNTRLSYATGSDLSIDIYRRTLYQPYAVHCSRNSSEIIAGISTKANSAITIANSILNLITSSIILTSILFLLLLINPIVAISALCGFGLIYFGVIFFTRKNQLAFSYRISRESTQVIKSLQEGLGGIRDVLINGSQPTYCQIYREADSRLRNAQSSNVFIMLSPRYAVEALGMVLIAVLAYVTTQGSDGIEEAIPTLGVLALGAQRLLPLLQQAYSSWSGIRADQASLEDTLDYLDQPLPDYLNKAPAKPIEFKKKIELDQLSFRYGSDLPWILNNLGLTIEKGTRIGFIGATGCGKSTLIDLLMGLLEPTTGLIRVDGNPITKGNMRSWQAHIAHVPQAIFLADASIAENIAFGVPFDQIDMKKVKSAAQRAQISLAIEGMTENYNTVVGERGVRLSGGQRQRIGIARALYKEADIIIFDEATSALDGETELAVMQAIESLSQDLTILIVSHRVTTLKECSKIIELDNGGIKSVFNYRDIRSN